MANQEEKKLFTEFPPVSTQKWEEVITADLKGADYEKRLVWKTAEGFNVRPYYRAENLNGISYLKSASGEFPFVRGTKANNGWLIHQTITQECPQAANKLAIEYLSKGAESIGFALNDPSITAEKLDILLSGISLKETELTFCGAGAKKAAELFIEKVKTAKYEIEDVKANFLIDPIIKKISLKGDICNNNECACFQNIAALIKQAAPYKRIRLVGVGGNTFSNSGSTIVQELAFTLAAGYEYVVKLMEAGLSIDEAAPSIRFTMGVSANYFMEIAKFRAARMLWANIVAPHNPQRGCSSKMKVNAVTSKWNYTAYDPYVNMLRGTTEAMSAAISGVNSIEVLPFDAAYESPTEFSARIARNTQLLLKKESHFDQVADASGGSYYIETLTQSITQQAWDLFKQVEEKGGYIEAFKAGFIQDQIEASAAKKDLNIATRREILLGTNQYPNFNEVASEAITPESVVPCSASKCCCSSSEPKSSVRTLKPYRGSMAFEQMRLTVDRSGRKPKAFMLTVGSLSFARARAQFACNFFACAGIEVVDNTYFSSVAEGVNAAIAAKSDIVVICSSDDDYATLAPEAAKLLANKAILVVAGAPACQSELETVGINHFISVKSNVLETLKQYLKELSIN